MSKRVAKKARRVWQVFLNDVEISRDCFCADSRIGMARVFLRNDQGSFYLMPKRDRAAWAERHGRVRFVRRAQ